ncbi:hypothetical protein D3C78_845040 [compost metagenome]
MRAVRGVGQHAIALEASLQHVGILRLFLPAALKREGKRKLRQKLFAGIRHICGDTGAVFGTPAADLFRKRNQFHIPRTQLGIASHLTQRGVALFEQPFQVAPGGKEARFVVKASPVEEGSAVFGAAVEQRKPLRRNQLHRHQQRQFSHFMAVGAVDAHFAVAQLVFRQANRGFTLAALKPTVQDKSILFVADNATNLQATKRTAVAERVDGFQHAGFAAAVSANQEIKAGGESEIRAFNIAKVADQQAGERHYSLIGMTT